MSDAVGGDSKGERVEASGGRTMLIAKSSQVGGAGGRELLCGLNRTALSETIPGGIEVFELDAEPSSKRRLASSLLGHVDGINVDSLKKIVRAIAQGAVSRVFIDGSNLGLAARAIKSAHSSVEVVTFFHNCEARFFAGALRQCPSLRALGVLLANYLAERAAVRFSDKRICLNQRDSDLLVRLYGNGATHLSPMALQDKLDPQLMHAYSMPREAYALFVGGTFYANRQGIEWFVDHVAAKSPIRIVVVGRGFEKWKDKLERNGNVEVVGGVDDLAPWYLGAQVVIAPIFDGSGMKTKVAEALMFGKRVIGTPEAFTGYEQHLPGIGEECRTAEDFIAALAAESLRDQAMPDPALRALYEAEYSQAAACRRLRVILRHPVSASDSAPA